MTKPTDETTGAQTNDQPAQIAPPSSPSATGIKQMIADQNDKFRALDPRIPGRVFFTKGVQHLVTEHCDGDAQELMTAITAFDDFNTDNDPHGEHDFGSLTFKGERLFWKIDLYDENFQFGSEEPTDLAKTRRVLTIMLPQEY